MHASDRREITRASRGGNGTNVDLIQYGAQEHTRELRTTNGAAANGADANNADANGADTDSADADGATAYT